jgi:hypothetical protein
VAFFWMRRLLRNKRKQSRKKRDSTEWEGAIADMKIVNCELINC